MRVVKGRRIGSVSGLAALLSLALTASAAATFPGTNGDIVFSGVPSSTEQIFTTGPDGQNPLALTDDPDGSFEPAYSANGERIAFVQQAPGGFQRIWAMGSDGSDQVQLTFHDLDRSPSFFSDGRIVFAGIPVSPGFFEVFVMNPDGSNPTPLTNEPYSTDDPAVFPDDQRIAFSEYDGSDSEIFVMNADGSNVTPVTTNPGSDVSPSWSPDGRRIVFSSRIGGDSEIVTMDSDGQNPIQLTDNTVNDRFPVFSPDGQKIAFSRSNPDSQLFVMDANGQDQGPLFATFPTLEPDWQALNPPVIDLSARRQKSAKRVTITVVSQNENATVTLGGTLRAPKPKRKPKAAASKKKTVALEPVSVQLQPGVPVTVDISVAGKGPKLIKKALKAGKRPKGTVTATAADDLGSAAAASLDVKYKKRKK